MIDKGILKRLAIALTGVFLVGNTVRMSVKEVDGRLNANSNLYNACLGRADTLADSQLCIREQKMFFDTFDRGDLFIEALVQTIIITLAIWLLIGIAYGLIRWVLNGRARAVEP